MTTNKITAGQIDTASGPFFEGVSIPAGEALRHPGRAFIGQGYTHGQQTDGSVTGGSWLQSFATSGTVTPVVEWDYAEDLARLAVVSSFGLAVTGASRTLSGGGVDAQGVNGFALNDRIGTQKAWGGYFDAVRTIAGAGNAQGIEVNATNLPGVSPRGGATPYNTYVNGQTIGLAIAAGSGATTFGRSYAIDAHTEIRDNGAPAHTGINFRFDAVLREGVADDRTVMGNVGYARAISMATEQGVSWYSRDPVGAPGSGTQAEVVRMYSSVTDPTVRVEQVFTDTAVVWNETVSPGAALFQVDYIENAGANVYARAGIIGGTATIGARGTNANITLTLAPKGTGWVSFAGLDNIPNYADDVAAAAGGMNIGGIYRTGNALKVRAA